MTEAASDRYKGIERWPIEDAVIALVDNQRRAAEAVAEIAPKIALAAELAATRLGADGRLVYAGAGTSGRVAVQDGVELGPTYGWPTERTLYLMAGGPKALTVSVEGAEDDYEAGKRDALALQLSSNDVVIGIAASGSTPYTIGVIEAARAAGGLTIAFANKGPAPLLHAAELGLLMETGPEVIAGSTRMKAGTAQKIALNTLSTAIMLRLGLVYEGRMVAMRISNRKLYKRAILMIVDLTQCDEGAATQALEQADKDIRLAILLVKSWPLDAARQALKRHHGNLAQALAEASF